MHLKQAKLLLWLGQYCMYGQPYRNLTQLRHLIITRGARISLADY